MTNTFSWHSNDCYITTACPKWPKSLLSNCQQMKNEIHQPLFTSVAIFMLRSENFQTTLVNYYELSCDIILYYHIWHRYKYVLCSYVQKVRKQFLLVENFCKSLCQDIPSSGRISSPPTYAQVLFRNELANEKWMGEIPKSARIRPRSINIVGPESETVI